MNVYYLFVWWRELNMLIIKRFIDYIFKKLGKKQGAKNKVDNKQITNSLQDKYKNIVEDVDKDIVEDIVEDINKDKGIDKDKNIASEIKKDNNNIIEEINSIKIGDILFHKYLGAITIVYISESSIKADTGVRGLLEFNFYDFGKVLYLNKNHSIKQFNTFTEYFNFCKAKGIEMQSKIDKENERKNLRCIEENQEKNKEIIEKQDVHKQKITEIINVFKAEDKITKLFDIDSQRLKNSYYNEKETLLRIKIEQENKIKEILNKRNIKYLFHFTRIENITNIMKHGIVSVILQRKNNIPSMHNDEQRIDSKLNFTSCSVGFPNYKLFYNFRDRKFPKTKWAILVIKADILFSSSNIIYFYSTNAANANSRLRNAKDLSTAYSFENMFCDNITVNENNVVNRKNLQISDCYTTDPQAEILISDIIEPKYIECINFEARSDIEDYISKNGTDMLKQFKYEVNDKLYKPRKDYLFWKKEN